MQTVTFQDDSKLPQLAMINRYQPKQHDEHEVIRDAVRSWAAAIDNQDVVSMMIIQQWNKSGGEGIDFPDDIGRARQKLFRFLDNKFNSPKYRDNVQKLTPSIVAVLPLEFRGRLVPVDNIMLRLARLEKEISEAKVAIALNAPAHQKLKELSEGIVEMFRVDPALTGPLLEMVTNMLGVI